MGTTLFYLGFAGIDGTFLGGFLSDHLGRKGERWFACLLFNLVAATFLFVASRTNQ